MYKDTWFENLDENMLSDKLAEKDLRYVALSSAWTFGDDGRIVISVAVRPPVGSSENDMGLGEDTLYFNEYGVVDLTKSGYGPAKLKDEKHLTEMWLGVMKDSNKDIRINGHTYMEDFVKYHKSNIMASYNKKVKQFPGALIAGLFNFDSKEYFKAADGETTIKLDSVPNLWVFSGNVLEASANDYEVNDAINWNLVLTQMFAYGKTGE